MLPSLMWTDIFLLFLGFPPAASKPTKKKLCPTSCVCITHEFKNGFLEDFRKMNYIIFQDMKLKEIHILLFTEEVLWERSQSSFFCILSVATFVQQWQS